MACHEEVLHRAVHRWMSDPSRIRATVSGRRIQILSPGRYNVHSGPDFVNAAVLLDSVVITGAIEFDKRRSYWKGHQHSLRQEYRQVILHLVLDCDAEGADLPEAAIIPASELEACMEMPDKEADPVPLEEVQSYALLRLLRMSTEHLEYYRRRSVQEGFALSVRSFLERYARRRRRPAYRAEQLEQIFARAAVSEHAQFLIALSRRAVLNVAKELVELSMRPIGGEGRHLRMEIITNCVVPSACVLASDDDRIGVFTWYWSSPALYRYGILSRQFPAMPQQFVWQQQGMLEMLRQPTAPPSLGEAFRQYGAVVALDFYRAADEPPILEDER